MAMTPVELVLDVVAYAFALWLGLHVWSRNPGVARLRYAGMGLITYALALAAAGMSAFTPAPASLAWGRWSWTLALMPALFWCATIFTLTSDNAATPENSHLSAIGALPAIALLLFLMGIGTPFLFVSSDHTLRPGPFFAGIAGIISLLMFTALVVAWRQYRRQPRAPLGLALIATLFFGLGMGLVMFPLLPLPLLWRLLAIGLDLVSLGLVVAFLDALDAGESLARDLLRSFTFSLAISLLFGGQVTLAILISTGPIPAMLLLLLASIGTAILVQTQASRLQAALDRLSLGRAPRMQQERETLRAVAEALPRAREDMPPHWLASDEFARHTRRALSHLGALPRLASNPLTRLRLVEERLARRQIPDNTLARATELQAMLRESIIRLKPAEDADFNGSDAWRFYNALYYPYVVGLKPYSRRAPHDNLAPTEKAALDWFRGQVPERTLYNWQKAAAELIAQDLRERERKVDG